MGVLIYAGVRAKGGERSALVGIPFFIVSEFLSGLEIH